MNIPPRSASLSRQSTPKKKDPRNHVAEFLADLQSEKRKTAKMEAKVKHLEQASNFVTRSVTPLSSKLVEPRMNIDLNQVCKNSVTFTGLGKGNHRAITERQQPTPLRSSPLPYRISPSLETSDLSMNQKNIECLRTELQQRREMIVGLKETVSRKQLEHKYWALVSEIEETSSRIHELQKYNKLIESEILSIKTNY